MNKKLVLDYLIERRKKNDIENIPYILSINQLIEELEEEVAEENCDHSCTSNCRREGCNCDCGEYHQEANHDCKGDKCTSPGHKQI